MVFGAGGRDEVGDGGEGVTGDDVDGSEGWGERWRGGFLGVRVEGAEVED